MNLASAVWHIILNEEYGNLVKAPAFTVGESAGAWLTDRIARKENLQAAVITDVEVTDELPTCLRHDVVYWIVVNKDDLVPAGHLPVFVERADAQDALNNDLLCTRGTHMIVKVQIRDS